MLKPAMKNYKKVLGVLMIKNREKKQEPAIPIISVIVPVHQAEHCLKECLDSILNQSFTDYEIILVDDGSTDQSGVICDKFAESDQRIRVFHISHGGASVARNHGLNNYRGKYLTFVDSDDVLLSNNYLQILYDALTESNADASICGLQSFNNMDPPPKSKNSRFTTKIMSGKEYALEKDVPYGYSPIFITKALFRRECFQNMAYRCVKSP